MLAVATRDVLFENGSAGESTASARSMAEFREPAKLGTALFSDRTQNILALKFSSSSVVATIACGGRLAMAMPDATEAGSVIALSGESAFWFVDGRISPLVDRS
jgi:hypothetical protein